MPSRLRLLSCVLPCALLASLILPSTAQAIVRPDQLRARGRLERPDGQVWGLRQELFPGAKGEGARNQAALEARVGRVLVWSDPAQRSFARVLFMDAPRLGGMGGSSRQAAASMVAAIENLPGLLDASLRGADLRVVHDKTTGRRRDLAMQLYVEDLPVADAFVSGSFVDGRWVAFRNQLPASLDRKGAVPGSGIASDATVERTALDWMHARRDDEAKMRGLAPSSVVPFRADVIAGAQWIFVRDGVSHRGLIKVRSVLVSAHGPMSSWRVYLDAATGEAVAREPLLIAEQATVNLQVPARSPTQGSAVYPASELSVLVDGAPQTSDADGIIEIAAAPAGSLVELLPNNAEVVVSSESAGSEFPSATLVGPAAVGVWGDNNEEFTAAVAALLVHGSIVQKWVRPLAPDVPWVDTPLMATVNIDDSCNAFSDGDGVYFFRSSEDCENTGRMADVIYHEYGHSIHTQALIPGIGLFDRALSEGISDYLAATITDDAGMGRGFFYSDEALRDIDPDGFEYRWPDDIGEVHYEGQIIAGALWDLRTSLIEKYGFEEGRAIADRLWMESIRRATGLISMYPEALLADDDDGQLSNGTPNACLIRDAFARHGLYQADVSVEPASLLPAESPQQVSISVGPGLVGCEESFEGTLWYKPRGASDAEAQSVAMVASGSVLSATLPAQAAGTVLNYAMSLDFETGGSQRLPGNIADRWYEAYFGPVTELYCTSFETAAETDAWVLQGFEVGTSEGLSGDPDLATDGSAVLGVNLSGAYDPASVFAAISPVVDTAGWASVHVQYRRWLEVEDGIFDVAAVRVDGEQAWQNYAAGEEDVNTHTHHRDGEWRFHDLDVSGAAQDGTVQVRFELQSDGGLEFGGWSIDEFCVVGTEPLGCGDGVLAGVEECDEGSGNSDGSPDTCRTNCTLPACGDGVVDSNEECDGDSECADDCTPLAPEPGTEEEGGNGLGDRGCGSCSTGEGRELPWGGAALGLLLLLRVGRRRRLADTNCV